MILFDLIINLIESFMFSYFLANNFEVNKKELYILITTVLQTLFLTLSKINMFDDMLISVVIILSMSSFLGLWIRKIKFNCIYIVLMYNCFIIMSAIFGIYLQIIFFLYF